MPFTPGDGRQKVTVLQTKPEDLEAVTATEANAGTDAQWHILKSDFRLSPTASTTHNDTPLGAKGQHTHYAQSQAEGNVTPFRDLDETGKPVTDSETEAVFELFKVKNTQLWVMTRLGPDADEDWAADDEYSIYEVRPDEMQDPTDMTGFIKYPTPLGVGEFYRFCSVTAGV